MFEKVVAKAVDGTERVLALVRVEGDVAFVCRPERFSDAGAWEVGFPRADVRPLTE